MTLEWRLINRNENKASLHKVRSIRFALKFLNVCDIIIMRMEKKWDYLQTCATIKIQSYSSTGFKNFSCLKSDSYNELQYNSEINTFKITKFDYSILIKTNNFYFGQNPVFMHLTINGHTIHMRHNSFFEVLVMAHSWWLGIMHINPMSLSWYMCTE